MDKELIIGVDVNTGLEIAELEMLREIIFRAIPSRYLASNYIEAVTLKKIIVRDESGDEIEELDLQ